MTERSPLSGRVALVTGGGRNIGRAIALALGSAGASVAVNVRRNQDEADNVVSELRAAGAQATSVIADVGDSTQVAQLFDAVRRELGPVSILVNNVGLRPHQTLEEITDADWDSVLSAGLSGAFYCARAAAADMKPLGFGRIINISGRDGWTGTVGRSHGVSTKAGLHGLTKALALELGPCGVTANSIVPGFINTTRPPEWYPGLSVDSRVATIPVGRAGTVDDIAELALFLTTGASFISGQAIHVNGGEFLLS